MARTVTAGIALVHGQRLLLVHPTGSGKFRSWSLPKGRPEPGETLPQTARREVLEETGVAVPLKYLTGTPYRIDRFSRGGKHKSTLYYWIVKASGLPREIPKSQLQLEEVDQAWFAPLSLAQELLEPWMVPVLESLAKVS